MELATSATDCGRLLALPPDDFRDDDRFVDFFFADAAVFVEAEVFEVDFFELDLFATVPLDFADSVPAARREVSVFELDVAVLFFVLPFARDDAVDFFFVVFFDCAVTFFFDEVFFRVDFFRVDGLRAVFFFDVREAEDDFPAADFEFREDFPLDFLATNRALAVGGV